MIRSMLIGTLAVLAGSAVVASAAPKDDVQDAAKKLADAKSYSWKQNSENLAQPGGQGGRGGFGAGPQEGKTEKDGYTHLTMTFGENRTDVIFKGDKGAVKTQDGWKSFAEAAEGGNDGGFNPARFIGRMVQNFKGPAVQAEELVKNIKDLKKDEGAYTGELTEEGAKQLLSFGRGRRPNADNANQPQGPQVSNAKGSARFWVENGVLTKYEYTVQGTMSFNGNDIDINRKTTVEVKDVGNTKVEIPDDAKAKLS
jgi:hypothetical protein